MIAIINDIFIVIGTLVNDVLIDGYVQNVADNGGDGASGMSSTAQMIVAIVGSFFGFAGLAVGAIFAFKGKSTEVDIKKIEHDKAACAKLRVEFDKLKADHQNMMAQHRDVKTTNRMLKAGLKMLLTMKKNEEDVKPTDVAMIEQILENIEK